MASQHDWQLETRNGTVYLAVIAFFSRSKSIGAPTCDGFHQYVPATGQLVTWVHTQGQWEKTYDVILRWIDDKTYRIEKR
jgi:hypothetical protein